MSQNFKILTTAENIVVVIWNKRKKIQADFDIEVILYETPRNFVTYRGE
jgi:6-pyruvoyltetrahydropterin/6-carboxytetrahydropterin synthase